jgi:hypothetical protein
MANKTFNKVQAYEREVKHLYAEIAIGASGAPTLTRGYGVTSVSRTSAGLYRITLDSKYNRLMNAHVTQKVSAVENLTFQVKAEAIAASKTIDVHCVKQVLAVDFGAETATLTPTATDPSNGSTLFVKLELKNSSVV